MCQWQITIAVLVSVREKNMPYMHVMPLQCITNSYIQSRFLIKYYLRSCDWLINTQWVGTDSLLINFHIYFNALIFPVKSWKYFEYKYVIFPFTRRIFFSVRCNCLDQLRHAFELLLCIMLGRFKILKMLLILHAKQNKYYECGGYVCLTCLCFSIDSIFVPCIFHRFNHLWEIWSDVSFNMCTVVVILGHENRKKVY